MGEAASTVTKTTCRFAIDGLVGQGVYPAYFRGCTRHEGNASTEGVEAISLTGKRHEGLFVDRIRVTLGTRSIHGLSVEYHGGDIANGWNLPSFRQPDGRKIETYRVDYGDHIVAIAGHNLKSPSRIFPCHSLSFTFASGREVSFAPAHDHWKGGSFSIQPSSFCLPFMPLFRNGKCVALACLHTSVHRPLTSPAAVRHYPNKSALLFYLWMIQRIGGYEQKLPKEVGWVIVGFLKSDHIAPYSCPKVRHSTAKKQEGSESRNPQRDMQRVDVPILFKGDGLHISPITKRVGGLDLA